MAVLRRLPAEQVGHGGEGLGGVDGAGGVVGGVDHQGLGLGPDGGLQGLHVGLEGVVVRGDHHGDAAVPTDEDVVLGEVGGHEDELIPGAGQGPEAAAQAGGGAHGDVEVAGAVGHAEAAGEGGGQGLPDGQVALGGGVGVDGVPLRAVQDGADGVVHLGRWGDAGVAQREVQHVLGAHFLGAEQAVLPDLTHDVPAAAQLYHVFRQIAHSDTSRSTQQRVLKCSLAQLLKATWGG